MIVLQDELNDTEELKQLALDYYYEWENSVTANKITIGDEIVILNGPYQDVTGIIASNKQDDGKYSVIFKDGNIGRYFEDNFEVTSNDYKFPATIRMVKGIEGPYVSVPKKDVVALIQAISKRKGATMEVSKEITEIAQRWNIGLRDLMAS